MKVMSEALQYKALLTLFLVRKMKMIKMIKHICAETAEGLHCQIGLNLINNAERQLQPNDNWESRSVH